MTEPTTDEERWEAVGRPEIICPECFHIGPDVLERVCDMRGHDQPQPAALAADDCPHCQKPVWWVPKCPICGAAAAWTYDKIKKTELDRIRARQAQSLVGPCCAGADFIP